MAEIKTEAVVFLLDYICDKCRNGKMIRDGQIILKPHNYDGPPLFPHRCESCGHRDNFKASYPLPKFEPK